jgi:hypothetical protein
MRNDRIARAPEVIAVPVGDELLLHEIASDQYVRLNPTAAFVWECLAAPQTGSEVAAALASRYDIATETATEDARRVIADLVQRGMARAVGDVT